MDEEKTSIFKRSQQPTPKKHRLLDLCTNKVHSEPVDIALHADSTKKEEEKADQIL